MTVWAGKHLLFFSASSPSVPSRTESICAALVQRGRFRSTLAFASFPSFYTHAALSKFVRDSRFATSASLRVIPGSLSFARARRSLPTTMQMVSSEAVEAAAMASKYRKYERDYLRRINHLYFSGAMPDNSGSADKMDLAGELFESVATVDEFVIKEGKEAPMRKYLAYSALVNKDSSTPKFESMDVDANLPSTSSKKSQRATPDGNRKRDRSNK